LTAAQIAKQAQSAGKNAQDSFNRFVEGQNDNNQGRRAAPMDENRRSFWDDFSDLAANDQRQTASNSAIGTSAMGMGKPKTRGPAAAQPKKQTDEWDDW
jgi:ADP-ribosylation factor GTPase-activating protein 1